MLYLYSTILKKFKKSIDFAIKLCYNLFNRDTVYKTGGNHIEVTAVGYGYSFEVEYHITKHKLLKLAVINTLFGDRRITYAVEYD